MSDKQQFFDNLTLIEQSPLFLVNNAEELSKEIQENCVYLSIPTGLHLEVQELIAFLNRVKLNRQAQLQSSIIMTGVIYYLWHDEQAGQLRFNFINSSHQKLPFNCAISLVKSEAEIVTDFLNSNYLQGISWEDLNTVSEALLVAEDATAVAFTCKVYREIISRSSIYCPESLC